MSLEELGLPLIYRGLVPDWAIRYGIRRSLAAMVASQNSVPPYERIARLQAYVADLKQRPLAELPAAANEQHYEVPAAFYEFVMGANKKYSCGLWPLQSAAPTTLDESEAAALALVCERARLSDSPLRVLDMGCGWGSFTLFAAARYPAARVLELSWGDAASHAALAAATGRQAYSLVLGADVIFWSHAVPLLFDTVARALARPHGVFLLAFTNRRNGLKAAAEAAAAAVGLVWVELDALACLPQPPPEALTRQLPLVTLYRMTWAAAGAGAGEGREGGGQ